MTVENTNTATEAGLLFSYYIVLSFWAAQGLGMSLLSRNVAGQTKKSVAVTMNFVAWAAGNAIGKVFFFLFLSSFFLHLTHHPLTHNKTLPTPQTPQEREIENSNISLQTQTSGPQVFLSWDSPRYFIAFATHLGCYTLLILTLIVLRITLMRRNAKRDQIASAGVSEAKDENTMHAFEDLTDKENAAFRYQY